MFYLIICTILKDRKRLLFITTWNLCKKRVFMSQNPSKPWSQVYTSIWQKTGQRNYTAYGSKYDSSIIFLSPQVTIYAVKYFLWPHAALGGTSLALSDKHNLLTSIFKAPFMIPCFVCICKSEKAAMSCIFYKPSIFLLLCNDNLMAHWLVCQQDSWWSSCSAQKRDELFTKAQRNDTLWYVTWKIC